MNPDPDLERLEERVREAFSMPVSIPQREPVPQAPFFPEIYLDCWSRYIQANTWGQYPEEDPNA